MKVGLLAMHNFKIMVALCLLCGACGKNAVTIDDSELLRSRQFLSELQAFSYCGYLFTNEDLKRASEKITRERLAGFHLVEYGYIDLLIDYLHLLESLERNALTGLESEAIEDAKRIKESLRRQRNAVQSSRKRVSLFRYGGNVIQLLFSIVRIREFGCQENLTRTVANDILGDELFDLDLSECYWIHLGTDWLSRLRIFRNFVLLSFHIAGVKADSSGHVEYVIGAVEDARLAGEMGKRTFRFVSDRDGWTLLWVRAGVVRDFIERFSLVPQFDGITCISDKRKGLMGVVYLSSDFSRRRREIFRQGETLRGAHLVVGKEFIEVDKSHSAAILEGKE